MKKGYIKTGFKVFVLNLVAGAIGFIFSFISGLLLAVASITGLASLSSGLAIAMLIVIGIMGIGMILLMLFINGWLAQKIWKWK